MPSSAVRRPEKPAPASGATSGDRPLARRVTPPRALFLILIAALLVSIAQSVAISMHIQATLGDASNTLYHTVVRELQVTTFLHVAAAAIAFWLVVFRRPAGYILTIAYGVVTVLLYTISVTTPIDPGPLLAPVWLYALGLLASIVMTLAGGVALRTASR